MRPGWEKLGHLGSLLGGVSTVAATVVGVFAIGFAASQIKEARRIDARAAYRDFMVIAMEHPNFSLPNHAALAADPARFEQYEWFVAVMLSSYEQVLDTDRRDDAWMTTIRTGLRPHKAYLCSDAFKKEIDDYDPILQREIKAVMAAKPACGGANAHS